MSDRENPSRDEERAMNDAEDAGVTTNLELAKMIAAQVERVNEWERRRLARAKTSQEQEQIREQAGQTVAKIYEYVAAASRRARGETSRRSGSSKPIDYRNAGRGGKPSSQRGRSSSTGNRTAKPARTASRKASGVSRKPKVSTVKENAPSTRTQTNPPSNDRTVSHDGPRRAAAGRVSEPSSMTYPTIPTPAPLVAPAKPSVDDGWMPRKQIERRRNTIPEASHDHEMGSFLDLLDKNEADLRRAVVVSKYDPRLSDEQQMQARREYMRAIRDIDEAYERVKAGEPAKAVKDDYMSRPAGDILEDRIDEFYDHKHEASKLRYKWDRTSTTVKEIENAAEQEKIRAQWDARRPSSDGMSTDGPENDGLFSAYFGQDVKGKQPETAPAAPPKPPAPSLKDTIDWKIMGSRMKVITSEDNGTITLGKEVEASDAQGQTPVYGLHEENDRKALSRLADLVGVGIRNLGNPDDTERKKPFNPFGGDPTVSRADIPFGPVQVRAYEKSDGTKVKGHERRRPGQDKKK